jgi:hypothetical protein
MKTNSLVFVLAVGMLAALPAHAWTWNSATYASRFRAPAQSSATVAKPEIQVAVLAQSKSGVRGATTAHPWGPPRPYAVKSH